MSVLFPIQQFVFVKADELTNAFNQLIIETNAVILQSGGGAGAPGYVTRRSLLTALNSGGNLSAIDTAVNALSVTNPVWIEYKTAQTISMVGSLGNFIASTLGYSPAQMQALWALALTETP